MKLGEFFLLLVEDDELYRRYRKNPRRVASEKGVSTRHVELIVAGHLGEIHKELQSEYPGQDVLIGTVVINPVRLFLWRR